MPKRPPPKPPRAAPEIVIGGPAPVPRGCYVYGLIDSDGDLSYIGKGTGRRWRASKKERRAVSCVLLAEGLSSDDAYDREREFILSLQPSLNIAPGRRSEVERTKAFAKQMLAEIYSFEVWLGLKPRTQEQIALVRRIFSELREMEEHGWQSRRVIVRADNAKGVGHAA